MAVAKGTTVQNFTGLSGDTKPTSGVTVGSLFHETNTGLQYVYNGSTWSVIANAVQGAGAHDAATVGRPVLIGGEFDESGTDTVDEGDVGKARISGRRSLIVAPYVGGTSKGDNISDAPTRSYTEDNTLTSLSMIGVGYGLAPDGGMDRYRNIGDAAPGLGVQAVGVRNIGAGEVQTKIVQIGGTSGSVNEALDPGGGNKVRIISVNLSCKVSTAPDLVSVYFHNGAAFNTDTANGITQAYMAMTDTVFHSWPDGAGPVGAAGEVVSWKTETETETGLWLVLTYRVE